MNWLQSWMIRLFGTQNGHPPVVAPPPPPEPPSPLLPPIPPAPPPTRQPPPVFTPPLVAPPKPVPGKLPPIPPPTPDSWPTSNPTIVLAATAWMEDRQGEKEGMQAVMDVVMNRVRNPRWWGNTIYSVCMKPYQFSCWNKGSTQVPLMMAAMQGMDKEWVIAMSLAELAVANVLPDVTNNADSYYSAYDQNPPVWADTAFYCGQWGANKYFRVYLPGRDAPGYSGNNSTV
jgi:N-acetylmuramoyl-L-alanine amidase